MGASDVQRRSGHRRRQRRRWGSATAVVLVCGLAVATFAAGGPPPVDVVTPPPSADRTTTTEFDPSREPGRDGSTATTALTDWDDAPEACAEPDLAALRADLTGDGSRDHIALVEGELVDGVGSQVLRICAGDQVWERQGWNVSLLTAVRVDDHWLVAWGGTSGQGRHQTLLAIADGELIDVVDQDGEPVDLTEGLPAGDPPQITRWWGCGDGLLVRAEREEGTSRWTVTRYRWDMERRGMLEHSTEVRTHDPLAGDPGTDGERSYRADVDGLADVLPAACEGAGTDD